MRRAALLVALSAASLSACDISPVDAQKTAECLRDSNRPTRTVAPGAPTPRALGAVRGAKGQTVTLAVEPAPGRPGGPWAFLFFFAGAKRAEAAEADHRALPSAGRLRSKRRQNVVVLLGRRGEAGSAPRPGDERRLQRCLERATS